MSNAIASMLQEFEVTGTLSIETVGNLLRAFFETTSFGGGGHGGGGGGGGGGKSATDKLIEKLKNELSDAEHKIKMVQYKETRYQNRNELTNYGNALQQE